MSKSSTTQFEDTKMTVRDASYEDMKFIRKKLRICTLEFFGNQDMKLEFRSSNYSLVVEQESRKLLAYANIGSSPNLSALPKESWLEWIHFYFGLKYITYGNTLFMTFLVIDDASLLFQIYEEVFLREPKIKYICTVAPPIDSIYEEIFSTYNERIFSLDRSINRLNQSIFVCKKYDVIPKMNFRLALIEDNDKLVQIIDQTFKFVREDLGDYYVAEQVLRDDPSEIIIMSLISKHPVGMIWLNSHINQKILVDNFEIAAFGNFLKSNDPNINEMGSGSAIDLVQKRSDEFIGKFEDNEITNESRISAKYPTSLNNLFIDTSSSDSEPEPYQSEDKFPQNIFRKWSHISRKFEPHLTEESKKSIIIPKSSESINAFAIQLFGFCTGIDPRRVFDLVASSFSSYPDHEYCILSLSSTDASSNSTYGPLLKYFSRVIPRVGSKISDCLYVSHRKSFHSEIELSVLTNKDISDVEAMLYHPTFERNDMVNILQSIEEYLANRWSTYEMLIIRCSGCAIGFIVLRQNCSLCEFETNYELIDNEELFPEWHSGELKYLYLHPAFIWEWIHVTREIFRLTGYISMFYKLRKEPNHTILNSFLLNMFPVFPRKQLNKSPVDPYALYYINTKLCHKVRIQSENKIVIVGFNEVSKGFLRTLLFSTSSKQIKCPNVTVITECNGFIEAEHDTNFFKEQQSLFFEANDQFSANFLRKLEFRTWVKFLAGELRKIDGKRVTLENGTVLRYDRLLLTSSSRYNSPKTLQFMPRPLNYIEINNRLDMIIFYDKMQVLLAMDSTDLPILIYGSAAITHSCVSSLIDLGIKPTLISIVIPANEDIDFPEALDDEYVTKWISMKEKEIGVRIYQNFNFVDWSLHRNEEAIKSVLFESDSDGKFSLECLAFISFCTKMFAENPYQSLNKKFEFFNNTMLINENSKTNIPFVYACGPATQYRDVSPDSQYQQKYLNQIEVGNKLAMSFIEKILTGLESNIIKAKFVKPIFRQYQLIGGFIYGGLRKPGRYFSRETRKNLPDIGKDLITASREEYCRLYLDHNGFVSEISCITRKHKNLEFLKRLFGLHETYFNNLRLKCECGEIEDLLDYFYQNTFSAILHNQFKLFRQTMRTKNLECLNKFQRDVEKVNKVDVIEFLKAKNMDEVIQNDLIEFIKKHSKLLHQNYALPNDFP
ncbi:cilia- and flagella-associated protein 61-like [Eupeodes corollae]|uniref:cilia- and flagella-associated protein 61-like n=1 Tax=Eupeodes corollae TaxID=290404 RepID=UPI002493CD1C|nr:cilia- and flagella-associated protein 61-like [Eupeodes corollae]